MSAVLVFPLTSSALAVGDPAATRTVYLTTIALVLLGIGLGVLAWWLFRRTRPEPELFAPLEEMETRSWRKLDPAERTESLDAVRPWGARPVSREDGVGDEAADDENADDARVDAEADDDAPDRDTLSSEDDPDTEDLTDVFVLANETAGDDDSTSTSDSDDVVTSPDTAGPAQAAADELDDDAHIDDQPEDEHQADTDADVDSDDGDVKVAPTDATPTALPVEPDEAADVDDAAATEGDDLGSETDVPDNHEDDPTVAIGRAPST